jgi:CubicO group peptidase (beta-lactamase class C family)
MRSTLALCAVLLAFAVRPSAEGPPSATPVASDPRVAAAVELARAWLEGQRAYERIPGVSAAIVHDQDVVWSGGFGFADLDARRPTTAETVYSICSISKLFTSVAVMQQRDEGRLRLDDPVKRHLPWFSLKRTEGEGDVTVEGLLTHASGLPRESDYPYWSPPDFAFPTHEQIVERVRQQDALYAPATHFQYSNLGLTLAGEIVAQVSGTSYEDYVRSRVLAPLGLASTTPEMPEAQRGTRLATGYTALDREGRRTAVPFFTARGIAPAAGYASTVGDLARFASWQFRLLKNGGSEVLKATTLREMHRVHWVEPDFETTWGLGFIVWRKNDRTFVGHDGSCPGYRTALLEMPVDRVAIVFMANALGVESDAWAQRLYDIVGPAVHAALGEPGKAKAPDPALRAYAGTYDGMPWNGETIVVPWEDGLGMLDLPTTNPVKDLVKLKRAGEHTFRRVLKDESLGETVVFEMGADGRATRFTRHSNFQTRVK